MDGGKLKTLHQLREKRVDYVRDDQTEHLRASGNQSPRLGIRIVAQLANGPLHLLRSSWPNESALIDRPGNRGGRKAGAGGDFLDVHGGSDYHHLPAKLYRFGELELRFLGGLGLSYPVVEIRQHPWGRSEER